MLFELKIKRNFAIAEALFTCTKNQKILNFDKLITTILYHREYTINKLWQIGAVGMTCYDQQCINTTIMQNKQLRIPALFDEFNHSIALTFELNSSVSSFKPDFFAYRYFDHANVGNTTCCMSRLIPQSSNHRSYPVPIIYLYVLTKTR